jgi:hypothetical protein
LSSTGSRMATGDEVRSNTRRCSHPGGHRDATLSSGSFANLAPGVPSRACVDDERAPVCAADAARDVHGGSYQEARRISQFKPFEEARASRLESTWFADLARCGRWSRRRTSRRRRDPRRRRARDHGMQRGISRAPHLTQLATVDYLPARWECGVPTTVRGSSRTTG